MNTPGQKPPVTAAAVERALDQLLPRLPFWARRQAQRQLGLGRDPQACVLRACLCAFLQNEFDCSNLLGIYPEEIWIQGESRPRKITPPTWASALIRGLDEMKQAGEPITGTDVLHLLSRLGLLVVCNGEMWGQGVLASALLREDGDPGQDRLYRPGESQGAPCLAWTIAIVSRPGQPE